MATFDILVKVMITDPPEDISELDCKELSGEQATRVLEYLTELIDEDEPEGGIAVSIIGREPTTQAEEAEEAE